MDTGKREKMTAEILRELGGPANIRGYRCLREAILLAAEDMGRLTALTKELYPEVARRCGGSSTGVQGAISYAIRAGWERGGEEAKRRYLGATAAEPTNGAFIAAIADYLNLND